jgi:hypothetical protein
LPATTRVSVSQRFEAHADDILSFHYVVLLYSGKTIDSPSSAVRAILINHRTESTVTLVHRVKESAKSAQQDGITSKFREDVSYTFPTHGEYELRFVIATNPENAGAEAHLLATSVRVANPIGQETAHLDSLSCVGRVGPTFRVARELSVF